MTPDEIKSAVEPSVKAAVDQIKADLSAKIDKAELEAKEANTQLAKVVTDAADLQKSFNDYKAEMGRKKVSPEFKSFGTSFAENIEKSFDQIQKFGRGEMAKTSFQMDSKAAATMTAAADLTGSVITTYEPGLSIFPSPKVNFRDLVQAVPSATGSYTIYNELLIRLLMELLKRKLITDTRLTCTQHSTYLVMCVSLNKCCKIYLSYNLTYLNN
jgi:hypothetical protein